MAFDGHCHTNVYLEGAASSELWGLVQTQDLSELWYLHQKSRVTIPSLLSCHSRG